MSRALEGAPRADASVASVRERLAGGWRDLLGRVERASGKVAAGAAKGTERAAEAAGGLRRSVPLRHGLAAGERGNLDAALALLLEAVEMAPADGEAVVALWNVALSCERPEVGAQAMARWIHSEASAGRRDLAAEHWIELSDRVPAQPVDAATLVRILPELRQRVTSAGGAEARAEAETRLRRALRACVAPDAQGLTPGLALRILEQARFLDAESARRAGEIVLAASDLHENKRKHVQELLVQLERGEEAPAEPRAPAPAEPKAKLVVPGPGRPRPKAAAEVAQPEVVEPEAARSEAVAHRIIEATPVELSERGLIVREQTSGQRTRVDLRAVEAIATGRVGGLDAEPVQLIDLMLRRSPQKPRRRIVRLRTDAFEAQDVLSDSAPAEIPLRSLIGALLDRSGAVPLPDPDGLLMEPQGYDSLEDYERDVLSRIPER